MTKTTMHKPTECKKAERQSRAALPDREQAALLGVPAFLVRIAGWERLKTLSSVAPIRHHCD
jgi:hypothetical protein